MDMIIARSPKFGMPLEEPGSWDTTTTLPPFLNIGLSDSFPASMIVFRQVLEDLT